ncbi:MAG: hypothetical protein IJS61_02795 [Firmicutes bacterium]|nr:hypothetical protein [Bacillota bacterium]
MKRKTFKTFVGMLLSACFMFSGTLAAFAQESELTPFALNSVTVGAYYQMGTYLDEPILWRCIAYDDKGPLMLSDRILAIKPFDAGGTNTSGSHNRGSFGYDAVGYYRQKYGSNYWGDSNIKDWLNSDADAGNVVWSCGNSPDAEHCWNNYLPPNQFIAEHIKIKKISGLGI